jgi:hypothetical protein
MAETIWEAGRLTDVWTPVGRDAGGAPRYRRAHFDILNWVSGTGVADMYVLPLGTERVNSADIVIKNDGSGQIGQEFGYYSSESMLLDPSQGDGMSDTLQALHTFGYV